MFWIFSTITDKLGVQQKRNTIIPKNSTRTESKSSHSSPVRERSCQTRDDHSDDLYDLNQNHTFGMIIFLLINQSGLSTTMVKDQGSRLFYEPSANRSRYRPLYQQKSDASFPIFILLFWKKSMKCSRTVNIEDPWILFHNSNQDEGGRETYI